MDPGQAVPDYSQQPILHGGPTMIPQDPHQAQEQAYGYGKRPYEGDGDDGQADRKRPAYERGNNFDGKRECVFRLLVTSKRVGGIIGRGGSVVKQLSDDTGARIKILDATPGCEERVVIVSAEEGQPTDEEWRAQTALLKVITRIFEADDENNPHPPDQRQHVTRLLISNSQTGCLIGKGGTIVRNIRESSGVSMRILAPEDVPPCAQAGVDRVVQVTAEHFPTLTALRMMTKQLRENPPKEYGAPSSYFVGGRGGPGRGGPGRGGPMMPQQPHQMGYGGQGGGYGAPPPAYGQGYGGVEQGPRGGGGRGGGGRGPGGDRGDASKVLVPVPSSLVGTIIGRGGSNIAQIRSLSGARVRIHDAQPGDSTRNVEIIGTPEEVAQAQQLVAAYVLASSQGAGGPGVQLGAPQQVLQQQQQQPQQQMMQQAQMQPVYAMNPMGVNPMGQVMGQMGGQMMMQPQMMGTTMMQPVGMVGMQPQQMPNNSALSNLTASLAAMDPQQLAALQALAAQAQQQAAQVQVAPNAYGAQAYGTAYGAAYGHQQ